MKQDERPAADGWLLQCAPGLAKVLHKEMAFVGAVSKEQKLFTKLQRNHDLTFVSHAKDESAFRRLRTAEMILRCPAYGRFKVSQRQLSLLAEELKALGARRLVVTVAGKHFQRQDFARFFKREMATRGFEFRDDIEAEVWLFCVDENWYFGIPEIKSREEIEGRDERIAERHGSLPPTIAAAMAFVSHPKENEIVLDPTCGTGTLLAEFYAYSPTSKLMGFDIDPQAIKAAEKNLAGLPASLQRTDATKTKASQPVSLTLANFPFGIQFGEASDNRRLYREILAKNLEARDPAKKWRGILLTSDHTSLKAAVDDLKEKNKGLHLEALFKVKIRGTQATAFRLTDS